MPGFAYDTEVDGTAAFEAALPYEETPDQAAAIAAGSSSMQIEVYRFDRDFEEESVSDPKGNVYLLGEYGYKFATDSDIALLENNIGFFSKSKNADAMISEIRDKIAKAKQELQLTIEKIHLIDSYNAEEGGKKE